MAARGSVCVCAGEWSRWVSMGGGRGGWIQDRG